LHKVGHESELKGRAFQPQKVAFLLYNDVHILVFLRLL
jgi:hypothetical protein